MGKFKAERFESAKQEWETPDEFFSVLHREFKFTCDVAADRHNAKVKYFISRRTNALTVSWSGTCWMNPPYNSTRIWVEKAFQESRRGVTVVCLIPARTNTRWWHNYCMKGEVRFICGRLKFGDAPHGLPLPLAVVVFGLKVKPGIRSIFL